MKKWIDRRKEEMTVQERIQYMVYKARKGTLLGWWSGLSKKDITTTDPKWGSRLHPGWELRDMYYDLGKSTKTY